MGGHADIEDVAPIRAAVEAEVAGGKMAYVHRENEPTGSKAMPIMYCADIIDAPRAYAARSTRR